MHLKLRFLVWGLLLSFVVSAQQISVKSFQKLEGDLTARVTAPKTDQNGDKCAIIKVVTGETGFVFEPDGLGITDRVQKTGEIWLYVPYGAKRLTVKHAQLGVLRNYLYAEAIEKATVYELVLTTGKVVTTVEEEINKQYWVITTEPKEAFVYMDDDFVGSGTGIVSRQLPLGRHTYRVECPMYHSMAGASELTVEGKKENHIKLKPAFGYVEIKTEPEDGAQVFIDDEIISGVTPCRSNRLKSGEHRIRVVKPMYKPESRVVNVADNQTTSLLLSLQPNFAEITVTGDPEAILLINGEEKGKGSWTGRIALGMYTIEQRKTSYRSQKKEIDVQTGEPLNVQLDEMSPIYGILDINTNPPAASLLIDGKSYGTTPDMVKNLLIGEHQIKLTLEGYQGVEKSVVIHESKITNLSVTLQKGMSLEEMMDKGGTLYNTKNYTEALKCFQEAAAQGSAHAQYNTGVMYRDGTGVEKDLAQAKSWFRKAADQGNEDAKKALEGLNNTKSCGDLFTDPRDGQQYPTVQVGQQCWMAKNLNYAVNRICYDNKTANCTTNGGLYTWDNAQSACPSGWHLPSDEECTTLDKVASGWNAQLGGFRGNDGYGFYLLGSYGYWWSSTPNSSTYAWFRGLSSTGVGTSFTRDYLYRSYGYSVRCLRNN